MDPEVVKAVKEQLLSLGYQDVSDALAEEFAKRLQEDEDFTLSIHVRPSPPKRPVQLKRQPPPQPDSSDSGSENEPLAAQSPPGKIASKPRCRPANGGENESDEVSQWANRLRAIQAKGKKLDSQMRECQSALTDSPRDDHPYQDVSLYYGTSERQLHPYPVVPKSVAGAGGFIRPPPIRASRKAAGGDSRRGKRLLYEERFPDYVPPPERRRDDLRWKIRQQLAYSDPKYH
jgi:hypothetical protein